jgi:hypothetical protein
MNFFKLNHKLSYALFICAIVAATYILFKSYITYSFLASSGYSYSLGLFEADFNYGYKLIANEIGYQFVPHRPLLKIKTDKNGNRTHFAPIDTKEESILYLGDSFTFGDVCEVDSTFPFIVEHISGYKTINGGVGGYGYAQMLRKADSLLFSTHPKYLVFQLAPVLLERSTCAYMPTDIFRVPTPYFSKINDRISIQRPYYLSQMWRYASSGKISEYMRKSKSLRNFISFNAQIYLPIKFHELQGEIHKMIVSISGTQSSVLVDKFSIETFVLKNLVELASKNNAHLILLILGNGDNWHDQFLLRHSEFLKTHANSLSIADAEGALCNNLPKFSEKVYEKTYMHWAGNPLELVDRHPNSYSHSIIAHEILKYIK